MAAVWRPYSSSPGTFAAATNLEDDIRPLLTKRCGECHSASAKTSGFSIASLETIIAGGNCHGQAVVPGHPEKSPIISLLKGRLSPQMPFGKALPETEIARVDRRNPTTGQRPWEVKAMRWFAIDDERICTIPAAKTKNKREYKVPLSSHVLAVLEKLRPLIGDSQFVFAAPSGGHMQWLQMMSQRIQKNTGFNFRLHDLRRTCTTNSSKLGVDNDTIAKALNHSWALRNMTALYNRWEKLPEMKRALKRWGAQLEHIVTGKGSAKVVPFKH